MANGNVSAAEDILRSLDDAVAISDPAMAPPSHSSGNQEHSAIQPPFAGQAPYAGAPPHPNQPPPSHHAAQPHPAQSHHAAQPHPAQSHHVAQPHPAPPHSSVLPPHPAKPYHEGHDFETFHYETPPRQGQRDQERQLGGEEHKHGKEKEKRMYIARAGVYLYYRKTTISTIAIFPHLITSSPFFFFFFSLPSSYIYTALI